MFKLYLVSLRKKKEADDIGVTISDLNTIVSEMKVMLNAIGQKVIAEDKTVKMEQVLTEQSKVKLKKFATSLARYITCSAIIKMSSSEAVERLLEALCQIKKKIKQQEDNSDDRYFDILINELSDQKLMLERASGLLRDLLMDVDFEETNNKEEIKKLLLEKQTFNNLFNKISLIENENK